MTVFDWMDPEQEHTDAVPFDRFDKAMWDEVREDSTALDEMVGGLRKTYDYVEDFTQDVFNLLAKGDPELRTRDEMRATHIPNRQIVQDMASLPELQRLRNFTVADNYASAMGMLSLKKPLHTALERAKELREQAQAAQQARERARDAAEQAAGAPGDPNLQQAADEAAQQAQEMSDQLQAEAEATSAGLRNGLRQSLNDAAEQAEQENETALQYGIDPGSLQRLSFKERAALAQRLSGEKLRQFAQLIGAFRQLASAEYRRRVTDAADEAVGVEFGNDLTRLTTQELINLASPETEDDFWRRYVEGGLLIKRLRGREREGRGPIIVVADESGSMDGPGEMWAKGLALALLDQARRQKRDFHYIGFGSEYEGLREFSFPAGRVNQLDVLDMAEGFLNGGTSFDKPLRRALDLIRASDKARPDIVFITDGQAPVPAFIDEWTESRRRLTAKCFGIYVTSGHGGMPAVLAQIADDLRTVADLTDVQQVRDIMRQS
jgi:uncharacterized protein with von Willebrand factor type A (vWA) domain